MENNISRGERDLDQIWTSGLKIACFFCSRQSEPPSAPVRGRWPLWPPRWPRCRPLPWRRPHLSQPGKDSRNSKQYLQCYASCVKMYLRNIDARKFFLASRESSRHDEHGHTDITVIKAVLNISVSSIPVSWTKQTSRTSVTLQTLQILKGRIRILIRLNP